MMSIPAGPLPPQTKEAPERALRESAALTADRTFSSGSQADTRANLRLQACAEFAVASGLHVSIIVKSEIAAWVVNVLGRISQQIVSVDRVAELLELSSFSDSEVP